MSQRRVTRSQSGTTLRSGAIKRNAALYELAPKGKQRKQFKKTPDGSVVVDQKDLEHRRQRGLKDGVLVEYGRREGEIVQERAYEVLVWGDGSMGQLGVDYGEDDASSVEDEMLFPMELSLEKKVVATAAGGMHSLMLMVDGTLMSFGSNDEGALGRVTVGHVWGIDEAEEPAMRQSVPGDVTLPEEISIKGIRCTDCACFVWTDDGRIFGWGTFRSSEGVIGFEAGATNQEIQKLPMCVYASSLPERHCVKLASGDNHVLALLKDGSVLSWGRGELGQLGRIHPKKDDRAAMLTPTVIPPLADTKIIDVFAGESASFFKTETGVILACGMNDSGQLGIQPSAALAEDPCPSMESSVQGKGLFLEPTEVESLIKLDIKQIEPGKRHTLVLTNTGDVYSFGSPKYGALGRLDTAKTGQSGEQCHVQKISSLEGHPIESIAAGQDYSLCIDQDGKLWRFGGTHSKLTCNDDNDIFIPEMLSKGEATNTFRFVNADLGGQHGVLLAQRRQ